MYLAKINSKNGLLELEDEKDGLLAIKVFRDILHDEQFRVKEKDQYPGIRCLTAIALTADYLSIIRFYDEKDRPRKAMEEVTGNRDIFVWDQEPIQVALKKYDDLQYDPVVEEGKLYYEAKVQKLKQYRESEKYYGKKHNLKDADGKEKFFENPASIRTQIRKINDDIKEYEKQIQGKEVFGNSPVKNGYKLSRLEQKLEKKNSFYNEIR